MTTHHVHVTEVSAPGAERPWLTIRSVLSADSAPCLAPVLVRTAGHRRRIACGRRLPLDKQCRNCAPVIVVNQVRKVTG
ncbi:hypothetical protein [Sphaerisporangium perillae]|uniref:hypothetical protein n=1 Tax=Sphaerisporangium perillae TaxID=2935860 RepID=UPI00200D8D23|nr:hypothetical protein [Sphaerisporangium perillae]